MYLIEFQGAITGGFTATLIQLTLGVGAYISGIKRLSLPLITSNCMNALNTTIGSSFDFDVMNKTMAMNNSTMTTQFTSSIFLYFFNGFYFISIRVPRCHPKFLTFRFQSVIRFLFESLLFQFIDQSSIISSVLAISGSPLSQSHLEF